MLRLRRLLKSTGRELLVLWHVCRHHDTPLAIKLGSLALAAYFVSPIDLIPDMLAVFGWVDDITLLALLVPALARMAPAAVLEQARKRAYHFRLRLPFGKRS